MFFPCLPLNSAACESEKYLKNGLLSYKIKLKNKKRSAAIGIGNGKTCRLSRA
ncbi:hypothetical protein B4096_2295 [Heyndrickxia coagulans]|nr:hypothetical protein B4096_2295 [Heyndrickxia coagulans]